MEHLCPLIKQTRRRNETIEVYRYDKILGQRHLENRLSRDLFGRTIFRSQRKTYVHHLVPPENR